MCLPPSLARAEAIAAAKIAAEGRWVPCVENGEAIEALSATIVAELKHRRKVRLVAPPKAKQEPTLGNNVEMELEVKLEQEAIAVQPSVEDQEDTWRTLELGAQMDSVDMLIMIVNSHSAGMRAREAHLFGCVAPAWAQRQCRLGESIVLVLFQLRSVQHIFDSVRASYCTHDCRMSHCKLPQSSSAPSQLAYRFCPWCRAVSVGCQSISLAS